MRHCLCNYIKCVQNIGWLYPVHRVLQLVIPCQIFIVGNLWIFLLIRDIGWKI